MRFYAFCNMNFLLRIHNREFSKPEKNLAKLASLLGFLFLISPVAQTGCLEEFSLNKK